MSGAFLGEDGRAASVARPGALPAKGGALGAGTARGAADERARGRRDVAAAAALGLLVALGVYFRLANLGELGFRWDEDLSSLAVRAILEKGIPELPSGMVYLRGGVFLYMMAASAEVLGFGELALRLPAALFGILLIPLAFAFGRALFGVRVGLVVAALITISYWDIEFSRYARMYAPYTFFYVLTLHWLWKYRVESERALGGALCIVSALLAVSFHQLGYTLVAALFFPMLLRGPSEWTRPGAWAHPVVGGGIVAAFFFWWRDVMEYYRRLPISMSGEPGPADAAAGGAAGAVQPDAALLLLDRVPIFAALLERVPLAAAVIVLVLVGTAAWIAKKASARPLDRVVVAAIGACCALQLFNFALLGILALAFLKREGLPAFRRRDVVLAIGMTALAFFAWLALAVGLDLGPEPGLRRAVRGLLDYPHFFVFWGYPNEWPLVAIPALVGGAWVFDRASRFEPAPAGSGDASQKASAASRFLLLALVTPLTVNGLFDTAFELFRYNVPLNTFYFTLVALALLRWRDLLPVRRSTPYATPGRVGAAAGTAVLVLLAVGFELNPMRAWLIAQRDYLNEGTLYRVFDMERHADFKTPSEYVAEHAAPTDTIIVLDSREIFNYLGRADYWVRTGVYDTQTYAAGGELRDLYVSIPLLTSLDALRRVLDEDEGTTWLIASDETLAGSRAVNEEIRAFIRGQAEHVVYVARDGDKKVYRFH